MEVKEHQCAIKYASKEHKHSNSLLTFLKVFYPVRSTEIANFESSSLFLLKCVFAAP